MVVAPERLNNFGRDVGRIIVHNQQFDIKPGISNAKPAVHRLTKDSCPVVGADDDCYAIHILVAIRWLPVQVRFITHFN